MTNHPGRKAPLSEKRKWAPLSPSGEIIKDLRLKALLTQTQAAELVHASLRTWQQWEADERKMPLAAMELWCVALTVCGTPADGRYLKPADVDLFVRRELLAWVENTPRPGHIR